MTLGADDDFQPADALGGATADSLHPDDLRPDDTSDEASSDDRNDLRGRLHAAFDLWLDGALADEPAPQGIPPEILAAAGESDPAEDDTDLYTLFTGLTGLTGEVRLQGRTFKQVIDALTPLASLPGRLEQLESAQADAVQAIVAGTKASAAGPAATELLEVLFDLHDRLDRGLTNARAAATATPAGFFARLSGKRPSPADALRDGYQMTLDRLEGALHQLGIQRVGRAGDAFDPQKMVVVDVADDPTVPDGTVLEVYRSGYLQDNKMLTTARVKVSRRPAGN